MGKHRGSDRDRKDGGSLTVKLLIVCVVVLVAVDGINRQHELVVESPHSIQADFAEEEKEAETASRASG